MLSFVLLIYTKSSKLSYATNHSLNRLNLRQDNQEHLALLDWLSSADNVAQQADTFRNCQEGTGKVHTLGYQSLSSVHYCPFLAKGAKGTRRQNVEKLTPS